MTGFGASDVPFDGGTLRASVRCVNHRFLDLKLHLAPEILPHQALVDSLARERLTRGRGEFTLRIFETKSRAPTLNEERARGALTQLARLRDEVCPDEPLPLTLLGSVPGLFDPAEPPTEDVLLPALREAATAALDEARSMREREGEAMARSLASTLERVRAHLAQLDRSLPRAVEDRRERLRRRVGRLLAEVDVDLDPGRLEAELALLADRADVAEETTRLSSHVDQFAQLMQSGDGQLGRKFEFLLQEMGRETNTIGAKSYDLELAALMIELKADMERMRELVLNIA